MDCQLLNELKGILSIVEEVDYRAARAVAAKLAVFLLYCRSR
jgi:hypothetical protein